MNWLLIISGVLATLGLIFKTAITEAIKSLFAKSAVPHSEYTKLKFQKVNDLFNLLVDLNDFIIYVAPYFINHYQTFDFNVEMKKGKDIRDNIKTTLLKASLYLDETLSAQVTQYVLSCERLTCHANNWGVCKLIIEQIQGGIQVIHGANKVPVDLENEIATLPKYLKGYNEETLIAKRLFEELTLALKKHLR